ncbi:MAG: AAA family ATPase [Chitinophagales bacterium]
MKLSVKNLGPIQKGEIDLSKRLYVFVGYNNSGKTYMSQLLWSLFRNDYQAEFYARIKQMPIFQEANFDTPFEITEELIGDLINDFQKNYIKNVLPNVFNTSVENFKDFSLAFQNQKCYEWVKEKGSNWAVGMNTSNPNFMKSSISSICLPDGKIIEHPNTENDAVFLLIKKENSLVVNFSQVSNFDKKQVEMCWSTTGSKEKVAKETISEFVIRLIFRYFSFTTTPFFLPANRSFYPNFYKYIFSVAKEEKELINKYLTNGEGIEKIRNLAKHSYTESMNQLITQTNNLNKRIIENDYYTDLLEDLEKIIGGTIEIISVEGIAPIEFKLKMEDGKELDMHLASSSSNQLTTLYLYLKYWARPHHNLLILDEPEENLHPQNQIALIDLLMRFGNCNNNRVLITTHSPLMTETINNYIQLSNLHEKGIDTEKLIEEKGLQMSHITDLKPQDFGVYFFDGKSITNYKVKDYGVFFSDFKKAERKVKGVHYILSDEIFNLSEEEVEIES